MLLNVNSPICSVQFWADWQYKTLRRRISESKEQFNEQVSLYQVLGAWPFRPFNMCNNNYRKDIYFPSYCPFFCSFLTHCDASFLAVNTVQVDLCDIIRMILFLHDKMFHMLMPLFWNTFPEVIFNVASTSRFATCACEPFYGAHLNRFLEGYKSVPWLVFFVKTAYHSGLPLRFNLICTPRQWILHTLHTFAWSWQKMELLWCSD